MVGGAYFLLAGAVSAGSRTSIVAAFPSFQKAFGFADALAVLAQIRVRTGSTRATAAVVAARLARTIGHAVNGADPVNTGSTALADAEALTAAAVVISAELA